MSSLETLLVIVGQIISGIVTGAIMWGAMRADLRNYIERLKILEDRFNKHMDWQDRTIA